MGIQVTGRFVKQPGKLERGEPQPTVTECHQGLSPHTVNEAQKWRAADCAHPRKKNRSEDERLRRESQFESGCALVFRIHVPPVLTEVSFANLTTEPKLTPTSVKRAADPEDRNEADKTRITHNGLIIGQHFDT
jgi:hypothetical protein